MPKWIRICALFMAILLAGCAGQALPGPTATSTQVISQTPLASPIAASPTAVQTTAALSSITPNVSPSAPTASAGTASAGDYTPTTASVWNFVQGPDNMTGACSGEVLPPYGLVQITPGQDSLTWRSQEPAPYTLAEVETNVYSFSGPTAVGDGTVTMQLTFTSATTLEMVRTYVPDSEPNCQHTHHYTATFEWSTPR